MELLAAEDQERFDLDLLAHGGQRCEFSLSAQTISLGMCAFPTPHTLIPDVRAEGVFSERLAPFLDQVEREQEQQTQMIHRALQGAVLEAAERVKLQERTLLKFPPIVLRPRGRARSRGRSLPGRARGAVPDRLGHTRSRSLPYPGAGEDTS